MLMKTAAKVFIWIGMIVQFYLVFPIVVGVLALKKLDEAITKDELQTFGIVTLFFCSFLGGIFMLSIKEEEIQTHENSVKAVTYKKEPKEVDEGKTNQFVEKVTKIGVFAVAALFLVCMPFAILPIWNSEYYGVTYIPLILCACQLISLIVLFVLKIKNEKKNNVLTTVMLTIFALLSIALIVMGVLTAVELVWRGGWEYGCWEGWVIFGIACAETVISLVVLLVPCVQRFLKRAKRSESETKTTITTSKLEIELQEVKRLYDNNIITEEEYNRMRTSVISKYYK